MSAAQVEKYIAEREIHVVNYPPINMVAVLFQTLFAVPIMYIAAQKELYVQERECAPEEKK